VGGAYLSDVSSEGFANTTDHRVFCRLHFARFHFASFCTFSFCFILHVFTLLHFARFHFASFCTFAGLHVCRFARLHFARLQVCTFACVGKTEKPEHFAHVSWFGLNLNFQSQAFHAVQLKASKDSYVAAHCEITYRRGTTVHRCR
jgi:hypothetical protein